MLGWEPQQYCYALVYWLAWHREPPTQDLEGLLDLQEFWEVGWLRPPEHHPAILTDAGQVIATGNPWVDAAFDRARLQVT